jgi:hypothetical protein
VVVERTNRASLDPSSSEHCDDALLVLGHVILFTREQNRDIEDWTMMLTKRFILVLVSLYVREPPRVYNRSLGHAIIDYIADMNLCGFCPYPASVASSVGFVPLPHSASPHFVSL